MTSFYGFDWQNAPQYSRLFSQPVQQRAQSAFGQGMSQFRQSDPQQLEKIKAAQAARLATPAPAPVASPLAGLYLGPDGRVYDMSDRAKAGQLYQRNNFNPGGPNPHMADSGQYAIERGGDLIRAGFKRL